MTYHILIKHLLQLEDDGVTIRPGLTLGQPSKIEIFISQRRNCESKIYLEMSNFDLIGVMDYLNQEPSYTFSVPENKPVNGFLAMIDLANPFTASTFEIEILNGQEKFWFVDDSHTTTPDLEPIIMKDFGYNIPPYAPCTLTPAPTPLPTKSSFTLNNNNATIILAKPLDYELQHSHKISFKLTATLLNGTRVTSHRLILITVTDYNDNCPTAEEPQYTWDGVKHAISPDPLHIKATDADSGDNSQNEWYIGEILRPANESWYQHVDELYLYEHIFLTYVVKVHIVNKGQPRRGTLLDVTVPISTSCILTLNFTISQSTGDFYVVAPGMVKW